MSDQGGQIHILSVFSQVNKYMRCSAHIKHIFFVVIRKNYTSIENTS